MFNSTHYRGAGSDAGVFFECKCECYGNWTGSDCDGCFLLCHNGGTPDSYCETCLCPDGFKGPYCDTAIGNQFVSLTITDASGTNELIPVKLMLLKLGELYITSKYVHPVTSDSFTLYLKITEEVIQNGFELITEEDKGYDYLRNDTENEWFDPTFGEIICTYDSLKNTVTGSYFMDMQSTSTGSNISGGGEFLLYY